MLICTLLSCWLLLLLPLQVAYAEYELEAIMLSGSCSEVGSDASRKARLPPPRGLQLHLGTPAQPHQVGCGS
jgi:UDP-glucose:glycoprotein glucosyltransferase